MEKLCSVALDALRFWLLLRLPTFVNPTLANKQKETSAALHGSLGSLVEICVKQTKMLIQKSIRSLVLDYFQFELLVSHTISLLNKRPIAFTSSLRSLPSEEVPIPITPDMIIRGYDTCVLNVIPELHEEIDEDHSVDYSCSSNIRNQYESLVKAKSRLNEIYHSEFLNTLIVQAIDKNDRYKPVPHDLIKKGDIVLLVEKHSKRYMFPMGRVVSTEVNELGEVTAAVILKGSTRERVYRHSSSLIRLISQEGFESPSPDTNLTLESIPPPIPQRAPRATALACKNFIRSARAEGSL